MTELQTNTQTKVNLNTYYILPLLKLNAKSWGIDNFIKSQVTKFGEVVVFIKDVEEAGAYFDDESFVSDVEEEDGTTMIIYSIPEVFLEDYQLFLDSKYSKMSMFAKDLIKAHSKANGLDWMKLTEETITNEKGKRVKAQYYESSRVLMALDLDVALKFALEEELDVKIKEGAELWNKLSEEEIIKLN